MGVLWTRWGGILLQSTNILTHHNVHLKYLIILCQLYFIAKINNRKYSTEKKSENKGK